MWAYCGHLTGGLGLLGVLMGALSFIFYGDIYDAIFEKAMVVTPGSYSFEMWSELDMPMYMKVYYFNCTNADDVRDHKAKPLLKQLGPYTYLEKHKKEGIIFNDEDGTVVFNQTKYWWFEEDMSNGTLDDVIVTINVIAMTAAESTRWPNAMAEGDFPFFRFMMNDTFAETKEELFMTTTIRKISFEGVESPLLTMMEGTPLEDTVQMPFDKFGWFYGRNGSADYDGLLEMFTGEQDFGKIGQIRSWNNQDDLSKFYPDGCSLLSGSAGEFFPPKRDKSSISFFTPDLCRTIFFNFKEETEVQGISGYKYWLDGGFIGNASHNASNECYNPHPDLIQQPKDMYGEDIPNLKPLEGAIDLPLYDGLLNVTSCKFNAPAYVSFPHFFMADPALLEAFHEDSDISPNEERHSSYLSLMPEPGIPLDVSIRMQINVLMRPLEYIQIMEDIDTMMYPMLWFESYTHLEDDVVRALKFLEIAPKLGNIVGGVALGIGALMTMTAGILIFKRSSSGRFV